MKTIFHIVILSTGLLFSQTVNQIKQAKEIIQSTGMSESQAKDAAKAQGYTDKQIDIAIQKEKASNTESGQSIVEKLEKNELSELGKSDENFQEQPKLEAMKEELPIMGENDMEIVDESGLAFDSKAQPSQKKLTYCIL